MDKLRSILITGLMVFVLTGCQTMNENRQDRYHHRPYRGVGEGPLYGPAANIVFAPLIQTRLVHSLSLQDLSLLDGTNNEAHQAEKGAVLSWRNPNTGSSGSVEVINDGYGDAGNYCREYLQVIYDRYGQSQQAIGVFCQEDGLWRVQYP